MERFPVIGERTGGDMGCDTFCDDVAGMEACDKLVRSRGSDAGFLVVLIGVMLL